MVEAEYRVMECRTLSLSDEPAPADVVRMSVVICSYTTRRWEGLCRAVESVLSEPADRIDVVIVIDHCDELHRLAEDRFRDDARVTLCRNHELPGLSGARNTGVAHVSGDVVAFVDDDAEVQSGWAETLMSHYGDPRVAAVGGYATPVWPDERPKWFPREFDWVVGCSYVGQPSTVAPVRNPLGCNMSVRSDVLTRLGAFSPEVGRVGSLPVGCEETELFLRLRTRLPSSRVLFDPGASVRHYVSDDRTTVRYFVRRCYHEGLSKAVVTELAPARGSLSSERDYSLRILPRALLRETLSATGPGLARAAMIVTGLIVTTAGYVRGKLVRRFRSGRT
ncbi:MAG: glycosyltransferase family 2 protein [Mycobacterium sp.]